MNKYEEESLSVIFSNLSKAFEKQQNYEDAAEYGKRAENYNKYESDVNELSGIRMMVASDLKDSYPELQQDAEAVEDRGVLRALRWGQKVTAIQKSLIERYESKGDSLLEDKNLFLCEACGFIFLGTAAPEICPVCKAPATRFSVV